MLLYEKISKDIRNSIDRGQLKPGDKIPSVNVLRQDYGVSHITALRVYKELTESNYTMQRPGKGYFVRECFLKRPVMTGVIGCFIRPLRDFRLGDNYFNDINYGIQSESCARRINLFHSHTSEALNQYVPSEEGLSEIKRAMLNIADEVDGFLIDERIPDSVIDKVINETGKPVVIVNRRSKLEVDTVGPADRQGMLDALEKISRMGYNRYIFCAMGTKDSSQLVRNESFKEFIREHNIAPDYTAFVNDCNKNPWDEGVAAIKHLCAEKFNDGKILIVVPDDSFARRLVSSLIDAGVTLGENIGISGFGGIGFANNFKPQLSTVFVDPVGIGAMALKVLIERISGEQYFKPAYYSPEAVFSFGETV